MTLMAGRERRSMMTGAQAAHCGSVSAISLGLPVSTAIPEAKGTLPKALFVGKAPISGKLKQRLVNEIESITMLALARSATGLADGKLIPEVLVIGLKLTAKATGIPNEVIDLIAGQRKSGIVFVCVRDVPFEGSTREECAFAVRRALHIDRNALSRGAEKTAAEPSAAAYADASGSKTSLIIFAMVAVGMLLGYFVVPRVADPDAFQAVSGSWLVVGLCLLLAFVGFGMGLERTAMRRFKIADLRLIFENDVRFLEQF